MSDPSSDRHKLVDHPGALLAGILVVGGNGYLLINPDGLGDPALLGAVLSFLGALVVARVYRPEMRRTRWAPALYVALLLSFVFWAGRVVFLHFTASRR